MEARAKGHQKIPALRKGSVQGHYPPAMDSRRKILQWTELESWRTGMRRAGKSVVVTNGCFDLLHAGHVTYLEAARSQGDLLLVGVNSDVSVRQLKGPERPLNSEGDRARVLAALEAVDAVCLFAETRATRFLALAQPDLYVKGGDFQVEDLPEEERAVVTRAGGRVLTLALVQGQSTTNLVARIRAQSCGIAR
jgi:D-glycero-beta-D-manno-heptose 1-phosphate adenylyltransferase